MCGICGKIYYNTERKVEEALLHQMADVIKHRGPDGAGFYCKENVGLGHRRLAIIDLETGSQPLSNEDGAVWIVFNGEIYNYLELQSDLKHRGHTLKTLSDTEVIVHLYEEYGCDCVRKLRGMFAFSIYDQRKRLLLIARDRVGIKPLYYAETPDGLVWGSEIKSILQDPTVPRTVNTQAMDTFLTFGYSPMEKTLFRDIKKLLPGHYLTWSAGQHLKDTKYWDLSFEKKKKESLGVCKKELNEIMEETVKIHLLSDVPIGFLLSGGVDSSALLSIARHQTTKEISTFTIGFDGNDIIDERPYARMASSAFGSKHYEMSLSAEQFIDFLPFYVYHMEEPVCEPPAISLYFISKLASEHVKVLLSGEGGDEAFAGYPEYRTISLINFLKNAGIPIHAIMKMISRLPINKSIVNKMLRYSQAADRKIEQFYYSRTSGPTAYYPSHSLDYWVAGNNLSDTDSPAARIIERVLHDCDSEDILDSLLYIDTKTWLPDDLLIKADKMTMANSVELRVPLLDHIVMEYAASLPSSYKVHGVKTKYLLKDAFSAKVPAAILNRKKAGFPTPYSRWMRTGARDFVRDMVCGRKALERGYFKPAAMEKLVSEHEHNGEHAKEVFSLLVLELWQRNFVDGY